MDTDERTLQLNPRSVGPTRHEGTPLQEMPPDFAPVTLKCGLYITMAPTWTRLPRPLALEVMDARGDTHIVEIPSRSAGLGGGQFVVSPSERFVVVSMFSGQSEAGYELFRATDGLRRVGSLDYMFGEHAAFVFAPDEAHLVMALPLTCVEWWALFEDAVADTEESGRHCIVYGHLYIHSTLTGSSSEHELRVSAPYDWIPPQTEYDSYMNPRFPSAGRLALDMPWGTVELPFPVSGNTVFRIDPTSPA